MKPGATIFVYHTGFLPAMIRAHMKLWRRITGRDYSLPWNHTEKVVPIHPVVYSKYMEPLYGPPRTEDMYLNDWIMVSCSAREKGGEMTPLSIYLEEHPVHHIKVPLIPLSPGQMKRMETYALDICFFNKRKYEKMMFLKWVKRIQTLGGYNPKRTDDKQIYCYEVVNEFDKLTGLTENKDGLVDIYQLWENPNFKSVTE